MIAIITAATLFACPTPNAAYHGADGTQLTVGELRDLLDWEICVCGPEGVTSDDPAPDRNGQYRLVPACNRYFWNGRRYSDLPIVRFDYRTGRMDTPWTAGTRSH